jgi:hypothetical protein
MQALHTLVRALPEMSFTLFYHDIKLKSMTKSRTILFHLAPLPPLQIAIPLASEKDFFV